MQEALKILFLRIGLGEYNEGNRAEYLLASGTRQKTYNILKNNTIINPRDWDMYKDKDLEKKGYINNVHIMTYDEAINITGKEKKTEGIRNTGARYWLASVTKDSSSRLYAIDLDGHIIDNSHSCWGIRPVVQMNDGVYIASGTGTEGDPYILGKD